jgi:multimeric flavodoxin WrbA
MNVLVINGSPRKNGNTATMLNHAINGAKSEGATAELVNLYDLTFKGCVSCFACKRKDRNGSPRCFIKDELSPVFEKFGKADAIIIGSPIYVGHTTSSTWAFIERLLFPYVSYEEGIPTFFDRKISAGLIFTMGASEERVKVAGFDRVPAWTETIFKAVLGSGESISSVDTIQFDDYTKYAASRFDPSKKEKIRNEQFPRDCAKAFDMGARFAKESHD